MKDLIKKVLVEHLLMEGDHPLLYDKYEFDGTSVSHFKTGTNVFLDNSVNIVDNTFGDTECIENTDICIPFTTLISTSFFPNVLPAALKIIKPNVEITIPANSTAIAVLPISLSQIVSNEMHLHDYIPTNADNLKNKRYGDVSQVFNQKGEWTHFYRDATDENRKSVGKHEIKSIKLKTIDKRNSNENK